MAKEIQYRVNIDTSRAQTDVKNLNDSLKETTELSEVDVIINTSKSVNSIGQLRRSYKELRDAQLRVGEGTAEFTRLGDAAAQLQNQLNSVNEVAKDLGGSTSERLTNSFGRIREGIFNLDLDKVTQGFAQLKTVFLGFGESIIKTIPALNGLTGATRVFAGALAATGIGLIVVAIGLLVANFDKLKTAGGIVGGIFSGVAKVFTIIKNAALDLGDALGLIDKSAIEAADSVGKVSANDIDLTSKLKDQLKGLREERERLERTIRGDDRRDIIEESIKRQVEAIKTYGEEAKKLQTGLGKGLTGSFESDREEILKLNEVLQGQVEVYERIGASAPGATAIKQTIDQLTQIVTAYKTAGDAVLEAARISDLKLQIQEKEDEEKAKAAEIKAAQDRANIVRDGQDAVRKIYSDSRATIENDNRESQNQITKDILAGVVTEEDALGRRSDANLIYYQRLIENEEEQFTVLSEQLKEFLAQKLITEAAFNEASQNLAKSRRTSILAIEGDLLNAQLNAKNSLSAAQVKTIEDELKTEDNAYERRILLNRLRLAREGQDVADAKLRELDEERSFVERKLQVLADAGQTESEQYRELKNQQLAIEIDYQNEVQRLEEETQAKKQAVMGASFQAAQGFNNALQGLVTQLYANEIAAAEGNFAEQERLRKESFEANKALQIVGAVMTTAQAVIAGLLAGLQMGGPWGIALGAITAAAAAATGAVQIATISATQYTPGSAPSATSPSAGATAGLPSAAAAQPNINFVGAGVGGSVAGQGAQMPFPQMTIETQVSVSETEITSTQGLLSSYESGAGLGGG
jgi:hypothetical protein